MEWGRKKTRKSRRQKSSGSRKRNRSSKQPRTTKFLNGAVHRHVTVCTAATEKAALIKAIANLTREYQNEAIPYSDEPLVKMHTLQDYVLGQPLGRGAEGCVFLAQHITTGAPVAIKIIEKYGGQGRRMKGRQGPTQKQGQPAWAPKDQPPRKTSLTGPEPNGAINLSIKRARTECYVMRRIRHRHIVPLLQAWEDPQRICLIMDYAPNGDLFDLIQREGPLNERKAWRIFKELLSAVLHLHSKGFVHRDIKPENVFLSEDESVMLGDFGFCTHWNALVKKKDKYVVGSLPYVAPEVLGRHTYIGPEADLWSLGVLLYEMLSGDLPFEGEDSAELYDSIMTKDVPRSLKLSDEAFDLLTRMLDKHPLKRASIVDIQRHPWLRTKPKKRFQGRYRKPRSFLSDSDSDAEDDGDSQKTPPRKWRKQPLCTIGEGVETKEY